VFLCNLMGILDKLYYLKIRALLAFSLWMVFTLAVRFDLFSTQKCVLLKRTQECVVITTNNLVVKR